MAPKLCFMFLPLTLLLLSSCSADQALIDKLCGQSIHPDLCVSMLQSDDRSQTCSDTPCMAEVSAGAAIRNASNTHIYIQGIVYNRDPNLKQQLEICSELYVDAMSYLNRAIGFIRASSYQDADDSVTIAGGIADRCEATFPNHPSILAPWNEMFGNVTDVCWELVDMCTSMAH